MATVYLVVALLIAIVAVIFAFQNSDPVAVSFFALGTKEQPLSLVLLVTLAIGVVIGLLVLAPSAVKNSIQAASHRKRVGALEKELSDHKAKIETLTAKPAPPPSPPPVENKPQQPS